MFHFFWCQFIPHRVRYSRRIDKDRYLQEEEEGQASSKEDVQLCLSSCLRLSTDNALDTHLFVLLITDLVADIHQCRSSASVLDKEPNPVLRVVKLQGLKQRQQCQGPVAPAEPSLSPFPSLCAPSCGFTILSYVHWSEGDTAMALD